MVCKFKKAIYGLKQDPQAWFEKFSRVVTEGDFQQCHSDHSLLFVTTLLVVYVDDILLTGSDVDGIEKDKDNLKVHFCDQRHR